MNVNNLRRRINALLYFFIFALFISGLTAIPLQFELGFLNQLLGVGTWVEGISPGLAFWITQVWQGLTDSYRAYPFLQYGTDWLAFAHFVIAIAFFWVVKDPVRNIAVIEFAMAACVLVIPAALIFGELRQIPFFWRLIDTSFGFFGIIPLWLCRKYILQLGASHIALTQVA
ncbi:MAG TPA: hypothetical protein VI703_00885 [Anaerolineales bacterium]|nr:hypothetical protein [Anaerolineales bacterium]